MLNNAYTYLIDTVSSVITGYSTIFPKTGASALFRALPGTTSKTLSKTRQYNTYPFNVLVRGEQDDAAVVALCDSMVSLLDMDNTGIIQCNVTSEPQYAYTDDNENIHYTFTVEVLI